MHANTPRRKDDLNDVERRLARWQPSSEDLNADAMIFAAGCATGRHTRGLLFWPVLCAFLAIQAVGLGLWGLSERAGRQTGMASRFPEHVPVAVPPSPSALAACPGSSYTPTPDDYFHLRQRLEQDLNRWLVATQSTGPQAPRPPQPSILKAGQLDGPLD